MEKATGIWGTRRGQCHRLFGLGLFLVILVLVWGFCYFSFFPRLETKKTQEGKKKREKKKKSKLGMPNTFKTQVCLNTLQILLCLWCFFFFPFWVVTPSPASPPPLSVPAAQILLPGCCWSCSVSTPRLAPGWVLGSAPSSLVVGEELSSPQN